MDWPLDLPAFGTDHPILAGILLGALVCFAIFAYEELTAVKTPPKHMSVVKRPPIDFTLKSLQPFNGFVSEHNPQALIFLSVKGDVFDASSQPGFYGPSGSYGIFAGHDATLALARGEVSKDLLDRAYRLHELSPSERSSLEEWHAFFLGKYERVGRLVDSLEEDSSSNTSSSTIVAAASAASDEKSASADEKSHASDGDDDGDDEILTATPMAANMSELKCAYASQMSSSTNVDVNSVAAKLSRAVVQPRAELIHKESLPVFTLDKLASFDGEHAETQNGVYVAVKGLVFDVTSGASSEYYGKGGEYHALVGRDATIALAKGLFESNYCNISDVELTNYEKRALEEHFNLFVEKYPVVGRLESSSSRSSSSCDPFSSKSQVSPSERTFTLEQLKQHSASARVAELTEIYIAIRGKVYDVSKGGDFLTGGRLSSLTGHDCSRALALQTADPALLNSRFDDLNFDEMNRLETWSRQIEAVFPAAGFVVGWAPVEQMRADAKPKLFTTNLHTHVDQGDVAAVRAALENDRTLVNSICVRTGLQPLHKAVEAGNTSLVKVLLEFGADRHAPAPLYDNETPIDMARRFAQQDIIDLLHA